MSEINKNKTIKEINKELDKSKTLKKINKEIDKSKISGQESIDKIVDNVTKLGIGFAIVSKDALEEAIKNARKESSVSEKEAREAVKALVDKSKMHEKALKAKVTYALKEIKTKSPVVTKKELVKLKAENAKLKKLLRERNKANKKTKVI